MKLSVAIPAFNEGKTLPLLLAELRLVLDTLDCEYEISSSLTMAATMMSSRFWRVKRHKIRVSRS
jgi:hypothetical protein